jgi:hypothetical protein
MARLPAGPLKRPIGEGLSGISGRELAEAKLRRGETNYLAGKGEVASVVIYSDAFSGSRLFCFE